MNAIAGIKMPKLPYQFKTYITADFVGSEAEQALVANTLREFEKQIIAVQIPKQVTTRWISANYQASVPTGTGKKRNHFKGIHTVGELVLTVEDSRDNEVSAAIDLVSTLELNVIVANLVADEKVLDAYLFTGVRLMSIEHSGFDYRQCQPSTGIIHDSGSGTTPAPSVRIVQHERTPIELKKLSFWKQHSQYYYETPAKMLPIKDLLGDI